GLIRTDRPRRTGAGRGRCGRDRGGHGAVRGEGVGPTWPVARLRPLPPEPGAHHPARPGIAGGRGHRAHGGRAADAGERGRAGPHRPDPDLPEHHARGRIGRALAVAPQGSRGGRRDRAL
ncbi:MAG: hypothetical protein AVDCRST_MAG51-2096, partial [uncultured Ramlibacter sp.]